MGREDEVLQLRAEVAALRLELARLRVELAEEVRTKRVVVDDDNGRQAVITPGGFRATHRASGSHASMDVGDGHAELSVSTAAVGESLGVSAHLVAFTDQQFEDDPTAPFVELRLDGELVEPVPGSAGRAVEDRRATATT
jgi:hypothetical protein